MIIIVDMKYTYRATGLARYYTGYFEALINKFTEMGVGIISKSFNPREANIKVKHESEVAIIKLNPQGDDIIVSFDVHKTLEQRSLEVAKTGLRFFSTILTGGSPVDATIYTIEDSFNYALSGQGGYLASTVANAIKDTAEELKHKIEERIGREEEKREEAESLASSVKSRILTLEEELDILKDEGKNVSKVAARVERARQLYEDAMLDFNAQKYTDAIAKLEAASRLLDRAESLLSEIY